MYRRSWIAIVVSAIGAVAAGCRLDVQRWNVHGGEGSDSPSAFVVTTPVTTVASCARTAVAQGIVRQDENARTRAVMANSDGGAYARASALVNPLTAVRRFIGAIILNLGTS
jgi:hypothetical protein